MNTYDHITIIILFILHIILGFGLGLTAGAVNDLKARVVVLEQAQ